MLTFVPKNPKSDVLSRWYKERSQTEIKCKRTNQRNNFVLVLLECIISVRTDNNVARSRNTFTVFSTQCSPFNDWNSVILVESHKRLQIPGPIVRIMSCEDGNYALPKSNYASYHVVRVPDWKKLNGHDFAPRNKGYGLRHWLHNNLEPVPEPDDVIILVDPDQIFISHIDLTEVTNGFGIAASYSLGTRFLHRYKQFCVNVCDNLSVSEQWEHSYGPPYILTAHDFWRMTLHWNQLTEKILDIQKKEEPERISLNWLSEMYSYAITAAQLKIKHYKKRLMISNPNDGDVEPWLHARWHKLSLSPISMLHYCQKYKIANLTWIKHEYHKFDLRECNSSLLFPEPTLKEKEMLHHLRGYPLHKTQVPDGRTINHSQIVEARSAWMYENVVAYANEVFRGYYEEFCTKT